MMEPEYYVFTGRGVVPDHVTHVLIDKALNFVPAREGHPNIEELICHDGVEKIEQEAFYRCPRLRRVIMPGVKNVAKEAFSCCWALSYVECGKLEIIGEQAFDSCTSLTSVDLPSIKIVGRWAFSDCTDLENAKFGKDLESISGKAFRQCTSLERISLPLKDGMITFDNTFLLCAKLKHIDLVEEVILNDTVSALLLEEWKNDMNDEIDSINHILPDTWEGQYDDYGDNGEKAQAIRVWIRSVLRKIVRFKAEHRRYVNVACSTLQSALPNDIVLKNVLPFLELPSYTFEGED